MPRKKTILVVEDEAPLLKALGNKIKRAGFNVLEAKNGREGLIVLKKKRADLVLLDVVMPIMDGMTTLEKIFGDKKLSKTPVIILSNLSDEEKIKESMEKGAHDYLVKSDWRIEDVIKKIKDKLK